MGETLKLTTADGASISAYQATPAGTPKGGIVVIQEIFGVNHHIRSVGRPLRGGRLSRRRTKKRCSTAVQPGVEPRV